MIFLLDMRYFSVLCFCVSLAYAQTPPPASNPAVQPMSSAQKKNVLPEGTPVRMRINRTVSSADAHLGDNVDFETLDDVKLGDTIVIPKGSTAMATVTEAVPKRRMARGGRLSMNIDYVRLPSNERLALRGVQDVKGGGHTGAMTGGMVATAIVFFPAAPFFLFMHGKDVSIPKGHEVTVYTNTDYELTKAQTPSAVSVGSAAAPSVDSSSVTIKSVPDGADISVDGKYVGSTPSVVRLATGDRQIEITKPGYKSWKRTMAVSGGSELTISATLETDNSQ